LQGETWTDGDVLYLSPTTAGRITNVKPTGLTGHIVVIGYVEYAHSQHGKIYTKIMNGWEVEELHNVADVSYTTPIDADSLLIKDSTASLWKRLTWDNLKTLIFTIPSLVSQAAGVAITGVQWVLGSKQWIGGNITAQKEIELTSPSYSFTTSSTITNAYSMYVNAPTASTNATITNNYAIGANGNILMTNNKSIQVLDGTGTPRNLINYTSADNININGKQGSSDIFINPTSTNKGMVLKSTGTIGIYGVATPTARLHVGADRGPQLEIKDVVLPGKVGHAQRQQLFAGHRRVVLLTSAVPSGAGNFGLPSLVGVEPGRVHHQAVGRFALSRREAQQGLSPAPGNSQISQRCLIRVVVAQSSENRKKAEAEPARMATALASAIHLPI
jgi:hypothetical protein